MEYTKAKGVSRRTLEIYEERLTKAFTALRNPYTATPDDIIRYLNTIKGNEYGYATRHCSFRVLRTFYRWLNSRYGLPYPMDGVPVPFIAKEVILPTLRLGEIKLILQNEDTKSKAIIALASASALRRTELANINIEDIDWKLQKIKVKAKGGKIAYAPILFAEPYLKAYLDESGKTSGSLFDLNTFGLQTYFRRLEERARTLTGNKNLKTNAHVFRRAFAVICKELGLSDSVIMQGGRWSSPSMLKRYTGAFNFDDANKLMQGATNGIL